MIKEGQVLKICSGAYKGHVGVVKHISSMITIEVEILGRKMEMNLPTPILALTTNPNIVPLNQS